MTRTQHCPPIGPFLRCDSLTTVLVSNAMGYLLCMVPLAYLIHVALLFKMGVAFCRVHLLGEKYLTDFLFIVELCAARAHGLVVQQSVMVVVLIRILCHLPLAPV